MIKLKTTREIEIMKEGAKITASALGKTLEAAAPGTKLLELEEIAEEEITRLGAEPAFKRVAGYDFATCLNLDEGVVHGLPTKKELAEGNLLSVDLGAYYKGFNTDSSWTVYVGDIKKAPQEKIRFLEAGKKALAAAINQARVGNRVGDISSAMQGVLEEAGYNPVDSLVGHGIGKDLHEKPQVPCKVIHGFGPRLKEGMTLAIEAIYSAGSTNLVVADNGWTVATDDGSLSGLFEHTVAVTKKGPIILTEPD
jgi:methionyl aminopeptidase